MLVLIVKDFAFRQGAYENNYAFGKARAEVSPPSPLKKPSNQSQRAHHDKLTHRKVTTQISSSKRGARAMHVFVRVL